MVALENWAESSASRLGEAEGLFNDDFIMFLASCVG